MHLIIKILTHFIISCNLSVDEEFEIFELREMAASTLAYLVYAYQTKYPAMKVHLVTFFVKCFKSLQQQASNGTAIYGVIAFFAHVETNIVLKIFLDQMLSYFSTMLEIPVEEEKQENAEMEEEGVKTSKKKRRLELFAATTRSKIFEIGLVNSLLQNESCSV